MRTALISDIHGNYDGLMAVLADIERQRCDRIICLGDLVDGGPKSAEVVQYIRDHSMAVVRGNHDETSSAELSKDAEHFLHQLPESIVEGDVIYTHTSPRRKKSKIIDVQEAWNVFDEVSFRRIFVGDIHIPLVFGERCPEKFSAVSYTIPYDELRLDRDDRYIICVGAVGYSRDEYRRLRYVIYDNEHDTVVFRAPDGPILAF